MSVLRQVRINTFVYRSVSRFNVLYGHSIFELCLFYVCNVSKCARFAHIILTHPRYITLDTHTINIVWSEGEN